MCKKTICPNNRFVITLNAILAVRGTEFIAEYDPEKNITRVYVLEGIVDVNNLKNEMMTVNAGEMITVEGFSKMTMGKLDRATWDKLSYEIMNPAIAKEPKTTTAETKQEASSSNQTTTSKETQKVDENKTAQEQKAQGCFGLFGILLGLAGAGAIIFKK